MPAVEQRQPQDRSHDGPERGPVVDQRPGYPSSNHDEKSSPITTEDTES